MPRKELEDGKYGRCTWCHKPFYENIENTFQEMIEAMYTCEDGSLDWTGEHIHRGCDYRRHKRKASK